ncbi:MAG: TetR family transcriptional regulator C-terminal domain-containing protein [Paracoccaceae bacterium]
MDQSVEHSHAPAPPPRKLSREARRMQLIDATIEVIAVKGYARTTLTDVANRAGLSHGLVNFHFQTKERLLAETLLFLAEEYRQNWTQALEGAGPAPARRLDAMLRADFNPTICTDAKLSAWCAFWGEAQCRPLYQEQCGSNDAAYLEALESLCAELKAEGGYGFDPVRAARVLRVTTEGVWLDMMTMNTPYGRAEALGTVHSCAAAFFPRHFDDRGLIG